MPDYKFNTANHIKNFSSLGDILLKYLSGELPATHPTHALLQTAISRSCAENGFFTQSSVHYALGSIAAMLSADKLTQWTARYPDLNTAVKQSRKVGVVMAGNIPLVGFHDFLCVLFSGNSFLGKLSQNDRYLLPTLAEILMGMDAHYKDYLSFTTGKIEGFDAVIATGSNNTSRYFEYYFGKYPHIIRRNRNSIAVLSGQETPKELSALANDIFLYFGLGCRNVSKLYLPAGYPFYQLTEACKQFEDYLHHNHFRNNYDYYKTIFLMNNQAFIDGGFYIMQENALLHNPVAVVHYEYYSDLSEVQKFVNSNQENLQCLVGNLPGNIAATPFGKAQQPELWDYADNIDTIEFLQKLQNYEK